MAHPSPHRPLLRRRRPRAGGAPGRAGGDADAALAPELAALGRRRHRRRGRRHHHPPGPDDHVGAVPVGLVHVRCRPALRQHVRRRVPGSVGAGHGQPAAGATAGTGAATGRRHQASHRSSRPHRRSISTSSSSASSSDSRTASSPSSNDAAAASEEGSDDHQQRSTGLGDDHDAPTPEGLPRGRDRHAHRVHVQPGDVLVQPGNRWESDQIPGKATPSMRYAGGEAGSFSLSLVFDTTADGHRGHDLHQQAAQADGRRHDPSRLRRRTQQRPAAVGEVPLGHVAALVQGRHQEHRRRLHLLLQRGSAAAGQRQHEPRAVRARRQLGPAEPDVGHPEAEPHPPGAGRRHARPHLGPLLRRSDAVARHRRRQRHRRPARPPSRAGCWRSPSGGV